MRNKIHHQTDLHVYEEIVSGKLNPGRLEYSELSVLQNLVVKANTRVISTCRMEEDPRRLIHATDITELGYRSHEDAEIEVRSNPDKKLYELIVKPKRSYNLEDHFNIPEPPDRKSAYFLALISDEFERIKIRANKVLNSTVKKKHLSLFAHKNIQRARKIQYDVHFMLSKIHKPWSPVTDNPDVYVIIVLEMFLSRIIAYYDQLFRPFMIAIPKDEQPNSVIPVTPIYLKYPYLYSEITEKTKAYNLHLDGSIFDHQFSRQVNKLKDLSESKLEYHAGINPHKKPSLNNGTNHEGTRLKWNGQLNVLVDIMLQLASAHKVNGRPVLEATPDELSLFIRENFLDKEGREISHFTLDTYLKPNRDDKKLHPESPKRIDLSGFLTSPET
jgi:hypothetical protein